MRIQKIRRLLNTLKESCEEVATGEWDSSSSEGKEGFNDMIDIIVDIERELDTY